MLLLFGTGDGTDDLYLDQNITCPVCGKKTTLQAYCDYSAFRLFFVPVYRWNRRYYARTACCGAECALPPATGKKLDDGDIGKLDVKKLPLVSPGGPVTLKVCAGCGYETSQQFRYCPMCGHPFSAGSKRLRPHGR